MQNRPNPEQSKPAVSDQVLPAQTQQAFNLGRLANEAAAQSTFQEYQSRRADETLRRQQADLGNFTEFLHRLGSPVGDLFSSPEAWQTISWGLVQGYTKWLVQQGYAMGSINVRLSTVKTYAKLAAQTGCLDWEAYQRIRTVTGYARPEAKRIDQRRDTTRVGRKKAQPVPLTAEQARQLMTQHPDTPQGRRDRLLMCLLLDHGLRVGEVAALRSEDFDLARNQFRFYRAKVDKTQTHQFTERSRQAAAVYLEHDAINPGPLLRGSRRDGSLTTAGLSTQKITQRVQVLGVSVGHYREVEHVTPGGKAKLIKRGTLSAHDCRHYWATAAARNQTPIDRLQDAGGWASPAMPLRYVEDAAIANSGVNLGQDDT